MYVYPCDCTLEDPHSITLGPSEGWTNLTAEIGFYQDGEPRNVITMSLSEETTVQLSAKGMVPRPVGVWIKVYSDPRYVMQEIFDLVKIEIDRKIESLNISNSAAIVFHHLNYLKKKS